MTPVILLEKNISENDVVENDRGFRVLLEVCVILNTYIYSGSWGVCTLHPAAHTRMTEVEALGIRPTVRLPSSITGVISRKFFHSRGLPRPPGRGNPLE